MSYRPGLPPALKNLNLDVGKNEKIGIVGRTGQWNTQNTMIIHLTLFHQVLANPPF